MNTLTLKERVKIVSDFYKLTDVKNTSSANILDILGYENAFEDEVITLMKEFTQFRDSEVDIVYHYINTNTLSTYILERTPGLKELMAKRFVDNITDLDSSNWQHSYVLNKMSNLDMFKSVRENAIESGIIKTLVKSGFNNGFITSQLTKVLSESEIDVVNEYIELITKHKYDINYKSIIILNPNITVEERKKILDGEGTTKDFQQAIVDNITDYNEIDRYIEVFINQNKSIRNKESAIYRFLKRILIGVSGKKVMLRTNTPNFNEFFKKYKSSIINLLEDKLPQVSMTNMMVGNTTTLFRYLMKESSVVDKKEYLNNYKNISKRMIDSYSDEILKIVLDEYESDPIAAFGYLKYFTISKRDIIDVLHSEYNNHGPRFKVLFNTFFKDYTLPILNNDDRAGNFSRRHLVELSTILPKDEFLMINKDLLTSHFSRVLDLFNIKDFSLAIATNAISEFYSYLESIKSAYDVVEYPEFKKIIYDTYINVLTDTDMLRHNLGTVISSTINDENFRYYEYKIKRVTQTIEEALEYRIFTPLINFLNRLNSDKIIDISVVENVKTTINDIKEDLYIASKLNF